MSDHADHFDQNSFKSWVYMQKQVIKLEGATGLDLTQSIDDPHGAKGGNGWRRKEALRADVNFVGQRVDGQRDGHREQRGGGE